MKSSLRLRMRFPECAKFDLWCGSMRSKFFSCYLLLAVSLSAVTGTIRIQSISVPDRVNGNSSEPLNLDCVFEIDSSSKEAANVTQYLVVKWSLNDELLYQWTTRKAYVTGGMRNRILEEQRNLTLGKLTHVPLTILNRTIELTGLYECQVATEIDVDSKKKYMHVYVPADSFDFKKEEDKETNSLNITCSADGLYPEPNISLTANDEKIENVTKYIVRNKQQLYDVRATFTIAIEQLKPFTTFKCFVTIPDVNLTNSKTLPYSKSGLDGVGDDPSSEEIDGVNGADPSGARYNINLMLALLSFVWLFTTAINRVSVASVKS